MVKVTDYVPVAAHSTGSCGTAGGSGTSGASGTSGTSGPSETCGTGAGDWKGAPPCCW